MPERMSIDWLLNEDDQSASVQDGSPSLPQSHETRHTQQQESWAAHSYLRPVSPSTNTLFSIVGQSQNSAHASLTVRQHRTASVSSRTSSLSRPSQPRAPRPKYSMEEDHFIWYQRIDLEKDWKEVSHAFNEYFRDRHRDGESGLQCRFYRILDAAGVPNIRSLKNSNDKERIAQFGLVRQTRYRYTWMLPRHRTA